MNELIIALIEEFRLLGIAVLAPAIILQSNGLPVGSNIMTVAAGAFIYAGEYSLIWMGLSILFFSVTGDCISYLLWKTAGPRLILAFPSRAESLRHRLDRVNRLLDRFGWWSLLLTRFPLSTLGPAMNILSGLSRYRFSHFLTASLAGEILWTSFYLGLGYWFGDSWEDLIGLISQFGQFILLLAVFIILVYAIVRIYRSTDAPAEDTEDLQPCPDEC